MKSNSYRYYPWSKLKQLQEWKGDWKMIKELKALERFYNGVLVYYGERLYELNLIDDEVRRKNLESIDKDYDLLKQALKRLEKFDKWVEKLKENADYAIQCRNWGQKSLELNVLYDPQPFKTLDEWDYWGELLYDPQPFKTLDE